ncbi:MAG: cell division topological specificity factor MinE [Clostridia bacterium]
MFDNIIKFFKKFTKEKNVDSKDTAKERLHLVLMQDRANVSADFLELMKQEIIEVIKKYIDVDESAIDVKLTNKMNSDGTTGAPALYANIPIVSIKDESRKINATKAEIQNANIEENKKEVTTIEEKEEEKNVVEQEIKLEENKLEETKQTTTQETEKVEEEVTKKEELQVESTDQTEENADKIEVK